MRASYVKTERRKKVFPNQKKCNIAILAITLEGKPRTIGNTSCKVKEKEYILEDRYLLQSDKLNKVKLNPSK